MSDRFPDDVMGQAPLSPEDEAEMQELTALVSQALIKGDSKDQVIADLTNNGWDHDDADAFVRSVEYKLSDSQANYAHASEAQPNQAQPNQAQASGGEGMGWLIWIGAILGINALSYFLDWGFWLY